jgi:hypothetical protein
MLAKREMKRNCLNPLLGIWSNDQMHKDAFAPLWMRLESIYLM